VLLTGPTAKIEAVSRGPLKKGGHKLVVAGRAFVLPDDPQPLAALLERWRNFYFGEFLPQAAEVARWQSAAGDRVMRTWGTVACPKCRRIIRVKPGEVGTALE
jgi:hypothetical protein